MTLNVNRTCDVTPSTSQLKWEKGNIAMNSFDLGHYLRIMQTYLFSILDMYLNEFKKE